MTIPLTPGTIVQAGFDKPWYASQGMIDSALAKMGFQNIQWREGQGGAPASRTVTNEGEWDTQITAVYQGAPTQFEPPAQIKWVALSQGIASPLAPTEEQAPAVALIQNAVQNTTPQQVVGALLLDLGLGMLFMTLVRNRKKGSTHD